MTESLSRKDRLTLGVLGASYGVAGLVVAQQEYLFWAGLGIVTIGLVAVAVALFDDGR